MAQTTIYLPDELHVWLRCRPDINVSRVCQAALRAALEEPTEADEMRQRLALAEPSGWPPD